MRSLTEIMADIEATRTRLNGLLDEKQDALETTSDDLHLRDLTELVHRNECDVSHEDRCGWYWEEAWKDRPVWGGQSHKRWLERVATQVAQAGVSPEEFLKAYLIVKGITR